MAKILIVDDAWFSRRLIAKALQAEQNEILEAKDGKEALEFAIAEHPDCMVLDLLMPELNGYEVLESLKTLGYSIPTIVMTADVQETSRQRCMELGAIAVLNKPPQPQALHQAIQQSLNASS
ncbi:response regulator [Geitlerinema sp. PCC 9228]|jgi:CheY-like chemotaxis protein|uniref:response regulator n=1 Tax=Geitlerinema sp. PCC 9228 TaxID=111611 RepID=UPI0008F9D6F2|nr:response regulator [Geitlerinema sp. PCC 9228]